MAERVVSWQALANFSAISKEAKKARTELQKLRAEQAALDAQSRSGAAAASAPGSAKAAQATTAAGNAAADAARKTRSLNEAQRDQVRSAREAESAARGTSAGYDAMSRTAARLSAQHRQIQSSNTGVAASLQRVSSSARSTSSSMNSTSSSMTGYARRAAQVQTASNGAGSGINRFRSALGSLSPEIKRDQVTILGLARAMALLAVPAVLSFINALAASVPSLTAGFIGLAGAISPVIGLLGALPGLFAAVGGGIGTLVAGFAGIGGALKAYSSAQKAASKATTSAGRAAQTAANRQAAAGRKQKKSIAAVTEAEEKQADVARDNARKIADAKRAVTEARRREGEVAQQNARQIASAQRALADARRNERDAERDITDARKRAKEQIDDLKKSLRDLRLEEEGASLSVEEAKQRLQRTLNDPASTDLERREAAFNVKEAEARLNDVKEQKKEADKALSIANKKGIEGSDEVVAAKRREADAHRATIDAERNLKETRQDAARATADAARATADAQRNLQDAQRQAAKSTRDANQAVADAKEGLGGLGDIMKTSTIPAVNEFREAMRKLTPEARAVVMQLIAMKPLIDKIRATAQKGLLPGVLVFLKESVKLFPMFNNFVDKVSTRFGDFFASIGRSMTTAGAMESWQKILDSTARVIDSFVDSGENLTYVLGDILEAGGPLTEWLAETVEGWTASWRAMTSGKEGQKRLTDFFEDARKVASQLGRIVGNTSKALFNMGKAFRPVGQFLLDGLEGLTKKWRDWTESVEGQESLKEWADEAIVTLGLMGDIIGEIFQAFRRLGDNVDIDKLLITIRDQLVPALEGVLGIFTGDLLNNLIIIASNIGEIIAAFGPEGQGVLGTFTDMLVLVSGAMAKIIENKAAVAILSGLLAAMAAKKIVNVVGTATGISNIIKSAQTVSKKQRKGGGIGRGAGPIGRGAGFVAGTALTAGGLGGFVPGGPKKKRPGGPRRAAPTPGARPGTPGGPTFFPFGPTGDAGKKKPGPRRAQGRMANIPGTPPVVAPGRGAKPRRAAPPPEPKRGGGARRAAGAAGRGAVRGAGAGAGIAAVASFLPGPIGEIAGKLTLVLTAVQLLGPAIGKLAKTMGGIFLTALKAIGTAAGFLAKGIVKFAGVIGKVFLQIAGVVAKAMLIIGRAMLANPWMLLIAALIIVVVLIIKYWDQIKAAIIKAATFIWNWLKKNWPLILKVILGPLGFLIVAIVKHWDAIKNAIVGAAMFIWNWLKTNWPLILKIILGPLGFIIVAIIKHWDQIKAAVIRGATATLTWLKKAWAFIQKWIIDPLKRAFAWVVTKLAEFGTNFKRGISVLVAAAKRIWAFIYRWFIEPLKRAWAWVIAKFNEFKTNFLRGTSILIQGFKDRWNRAKGIVTDAIKNAISAAGKGLKLLRDKVSEWMGKIGKAWDKFKDAAKKPINWVIRNVLNKGIVKAFNWVMDKLGMKDKQIKGDIPEIGGGGDKPIPNVATGGQIPKNRAGGVLRGPGTGTSDSILGINHRGVPTARVSNGEYVVNEKATKKNKRLLDAINSGKVKQQKMHNGPGYERTVDFGKAMGGLVGSLKSIPGLFLGGRAPIGGAWNRHSDYSFARWAGDNPTPRGTPVHAWKAGTTAQANRWNYSYGNHVRINHGGGEQSLYAHLSAILTRVGEKISAGEVIGLSGSSGNSTGPHLHFEVRGGNSPLGKDTGLLSKAISVINAPKKFANKIKGPIADMKKKYGDSTLGQTAIGAVEKIKDLTAEKVKGYWEEAKAAAAAASAGPSGRFTAAGGGTNRAIGKRMMLQRWPASEWPALNSLWTKESGWRTTAKNPSSGAYGIPQSLPASKMASAGKDWRTNPATQIKWGLGYIASRYGSPSKAWAHSQRTNWYARGTSGASPGWAVVGENGPEMMKMKGGEKVVPTQKLHSGGVVLGAKQGSKGAWVRAIRRQIPSASSSQTWTAHLSDLLKDDKNPPVRDKASFVKDTAMLAKAASTLKKSKKNMSVSTLADKIGRDPYWLWLHYDRMGATPFKDYFKANGVSSSKRSSLEKSIKSWGSARTKDTKALEKFLGLTQDGTFDEEVAAAVRHMADHAFGYAVGTHGHTANDIIPWDIGKGGIAGALAEQVRTNALNAEFDRLIDQFRQWGLNALVTRFTEVGPADGLAIMRDLSKNQSAATDYNAAVQVELDRAAKAEDPTEQQIVKFMEAVRAGVRVGLQGASSAAGVAIDTGAKLYDIITSQNRWGTIPSSQWGAGSRLAMDIEQFKNLFKFHFGGRVPGSGNRDTVPSMLTPGEFVLRRGAASAIAAEQGPGALYALNNYDKFANGGYVAAGATRPAMPVASTYGRMTAASHANAGATKVVNYNFDTTVHNPIAEPASVSVQKRVQRVARLGLLAGDKE